ncbi:MAG: 16S rRNA (cytidine(1402)-2'-O)-methyltransferase [Mariprofundales bacterium]|nr:16S rRNA (cytidine(1402)-2'-O)-methyltransferase [Mariprofundales bacterium]
MRVSTEPAPGSLYIVATPIGNLADITLRALEVLRGVDWIAAEDTRTSRKLMDHYQISTPLIACHEHNEQFMAAGMVARLKQGECGALISDAGTPLISDPGYRLARVCVAAEVPLVPIPGASSVMTALCACGLPPHPFLFVGFLPRSGGGRERRLQAIVDAPHTVVVLESPRRVAATLEDLVRLGGENHFAVMARELTKLHETFVRGSVETLLTQVRATPPKGEVVLLFAPPDQDAVREVGDADILSRLSALDAGQHSASQRAKAVAQQLGISKQRVYDLLHGE